MSFAPPRWGPVASGAPLQTLNSSVSSWRVILGASGVIAYLVLSHWLTVKSAGQPWAIAAFLAPAWGVALAVAIGKRKRGAFVALLLAAPVVALVVAHGGIGDVDRLYVLEHAGIHLALFASFALTLRTGRVSLIGRVAARVHGTVTPAVIAYTRKVTVAWALYFVSMAALSVLVYLGCAWAVWSLLANVATPIAIVILFFGEHLLRYRLHPEFERATLADAVRAYLRTKSPREAVRQ